MNKKELVRAIRQQVDGVRISKIDEIISTACEVIMDTTANGEQIALWGFASITPSVRRAHIGTNPKTGETINVPEVKTVRLTPGDAWHRKLKGEVE